MLRVKLPFLDGWSAARRRNAERYRALVAAAGLDEVVVVPEDVPGHIYNQFVVRVPRRDELQAHLREQGIGTEVYYPVPLHLQPVFADLGQGEGTFPVAENAARRVISLPMHPYLTEQQQQSVVDAVRTALAG